MATASEKSPGDMASVDPRPGDWFDSCSQERFSNDRTKRDLYAWDPYFRDCVDGLSPLNERSRERLLFSHVPLIFRPDALLTGQYEEVLELVEAAGFSAILVDEFRFDRFRVRECWKYQMNTATRERLDVFDMMLVDQPAAYLLLRREPADGRSACEALNDLKGGSDPTTRRPGHLRYSSSRVQLSVFTYIHVPDEPLDFLRELGAFFGCNERKLIVDRALSGPVVDPRAAVRTLAGRLGHNALTAESAWNSIREACPADAVGDVLRLEHAWRMQPRHWRAILSELKQRVPAVNHWDLVAISARSALTHDPSRAPVIAPKYVHAK